ncbi:MAG TPA: sugar nucleotide-binding protein [Candidatus Paceibacterota bacterium]|nr:sugar nucleotide-binding protein [Candidatus Paceibacterota bacterium]
MKVLVFGNGWLGNKFKDIFGGIITDTRIEDAGMVRRDIETFRPDVVINTAGKPSGDNNTDWCLDHPGKTMVSNVVGPAVLAQACKDFDVPSFVFLSSGCIFNGPGDVLFSETSAVNPVNFYGWTKVASEVVVREIFRDRPSRLLIPRFRMPLDKEPHSRNLLTKLLRYRIGAPIVHALNSVTVVDDMIAAIKILVERNEFGTFHVVNPEPVTHLQILRWCFELGLIKTWKPLNLQVPSQFAELRVTKDGRSNCVLDDTKLRLINRIVLRDSEEAIKSCIAEYKRRVNEVVEL